MNKLLGALALCGPAFVLSLGPTGCQKPSPGPTKETVGAKAPPTPTPQVETREAPIALGVEKPSVELVLDGKMPAEIKVRVKGTSLPNEVKGGNDHVKAVILLAQPGGSFIKVSADNGAKPGLYEFVISNKSEKVSLAVNVSEAKKGETKKEETKKDDAK